MAQVFASREKYYETKFAKLSQLILADSVVCFVFFISASGNDSSDVVNE